MGEKVDKVLVSGKFRVIHSGHIRLFRAATDLGHRLIVALDVQGLSSDEVDWRRGILGSFERVEVIEFKSDIKELIRSIQPDIVVKGQEFSSLRNEEEAVLAEYGGRLVFSSGTSFYSESDLIGSADSDSLQGITSMPKSFMERNTITTDHLLALLDRLSQLRVCVVGDLIVDEYVNCHALGMSQEDPSLVVTPVDKRRFLGGAGIVAAHSRSLGAQTTFMTVTGEDETSEWAFGVAADYKVRIVNIYDNRRPTTLKQRFRSGSQTLLKVSHLSQNFLDPAKEELLLDNFKNVVSNIDALILSDFSYGVLSSQLSKQMINLAKDNNVVVCADSQSSSQIGNLSKFEGADLIAATEREARLELRDASAGLVVIAESLRARLAAKNVLLKLGSDGVLISAVNAFNETIATDEIGSLNQAPVDTSGAGDSMLAAASLSLAAGASIHEAALLGSLLSGIQVSRLGNVPISAVDVKTILQP